MIPIRCGAFLIYLTICISISLGLKCRIDEGPSDEDMKRITRSCMRKISENGGQYNQNQSDSSYGNDDNNNWDYEEYNRDDRSRQSNRDRLQMRGRSERSGNDRKYDYPTNRDRNGHQNQRSSGNSNNNNNHNHHGRNLGSNNNNNNNNNNNSSYGDRHSRNMQHDQDGACVVHCFFDELNVLNNDDYPDKHKFTYILTKDIRDRELRGFYSDTIQDCFHYVETQRHKDKCQFSREIINCMTDYAKLNCDDWQDHTLIFT